MNGTTDVPPTPRRISNVQALTLLAAVAVALRFLMFAGRGDYVAFDEGWYLLLGRNVMAGDGYTLAGLRHAVLSPLFPLLAGAASVVTGDIIWAGRAVAAVCAGVLVVPCWFLFRRLADERTAWVGCLIVVALPTLAPFTVPFWIDWDLWVGAEPVLHLFLYCGLALVLRAYDSGAMRDWIAAGIAFALAYLARPEAIVILGAIALALAVYSVASRRPRRLLGVLVLGAVFCTAALPYWNYLRVTLGHWTVTGRGVQVPSAAAVRGDERQAASSIEQMLWGESQRVYVQVLYGLDPSGTRLRSSYWGVPGDSPAAVIPGPTRITNGAAAPDSIARPSADREPASDTATAAVQLERNDPVGHWTLYGRALIRAVPWYLLLLGLVGAVFSRIRRDGQLIVVVPLVATSLAIASMVGSDPRTQLFLAPIIALYAAAGVLVTTHFVVRRPGVTLRPAFIRNVFTALLLAALFAVQARWLFLSLTVPSPHHTVGAANRMLGEAVGASLPPDAPVMSWHPAVALFANRDWRVLPYASFEQIVRYASAIRCETVVFSGFHPGSQFIRDFPRDHLILNVPRAIASADAFRVEIESAGESHLIGRLRPLPPGPSEDPRP